LAPSSIVLRYTQTKLFSKLLFLFFLYIFFSNKKCYFFINDFF